MLKDPWFIIRHVTPLILDFCSSTNLILFRTKDGKWVTRSREVPTGNGEPEVDEDEAEEEEDDSSSESEEEKKAKKPVSVVDILAKRRVLLAEAKVQVKNQVRFYTISQTLLPHPV